MINEDLFIKNIHSKNQDRISVALVYDTLSKEAHRGCGLYYEIYESCFIGLLRDHLSELNEADANKLIDELKLHGIPAVAIGTFIKEKKYIITHHTKMELLPPKSDELYSVLK